jgi:hypothetical protein
MITGGVNAGIFLPHVTDTGVTAFEKSRSPVCRSIINYDQLPINVILVTHALKRTLKHVATIERGQYYGDGRNQGLDAILE